MTPQEREEREARLVELEAKRACLVEQRAATLAALDRAEAARRLRRHGFDEATWLYEAGIEEDDAS